MERRKVLKTLGISAAVFSTGLINACKNEDIEAKKELKKLKDSLKKTKNKPISEREKKIINRSQMEIKDPENPTKLELKHTPEIKIGDKDDLDYTEIKITIGTGIIHPSTKAHWIDYIKLFADDELIGDVEYEAGMASGYTVFKIKTEDIHKLRAECGCNIHGIWHSELKLS